MWFNLLLAGGAAIASLVTGSAVTAADMWKCAQAGGPVLFSDGGGAGCQEVKALPELQSAGASPVRKPVEPQPTVEVVVPASIPKAAVQLSARPFDSISRSVPNLYYVQRFSASAAAKGWNAPNKGDGTPIDLRQLIPLDKPAMRVRYDLAEQGDGLLQAVRALVARRRTHAAVSLLASAGGR